MAKVLTEAELAELLKVHTTPGMAQKIIIRNQRILAALRARKSENIRLGCPHCAATRRKDGNTGSAVSCANCAYSKALGEVNLTACLQYSFGGITANDVHGIELCTDSVFVSDDIMPEYREDAIIWARGHIEWAREVIRRAKRRRG